MSLSLYGLSRQDLKLLVVDFFSNKACPYMSKNRYRTRII